ncbi:MAG TPA: alpha/beta fold hydrolase [Sphingomicrobium sp.]|nr:alpha/beta fold hydrolase [Sphingomicrobium sp.]
MGRVTIGSGMRIGVAEAGGGAGTPILFLHGVGSTKRVWDSQIDFFGRSRRALAFDYPGYGESDPLPAATREDFAASVLAALSALGIERAHVCGLSLGGVIAIAMHDQAPERCASLVLADSFAVHPEGRAIYERSVAASRAASMRELAEARAGALLAPGARAALYREVIDTMASIEAGAYRLGAEAVWLADQRDRAARITVPTLVLCGEVDKVTPPELSRELAALVPAARLQLIPGAGHLANIEQPVAFNHAVDEFIAAAEHAVQQPR